MAGMTKTPGNTATSTTSKPAPRDFRQEVTESIIELMEKGIAPWQKPWDGSFFLPINHTTQKNYRGGNALHLMIVGMKRGYTDPRWMTYKQAEERGWQVQKAQKGTQVEFWDIRKAAGSKAETPGDGDKPQDDREGERAESGKPLSQKRLIHKIYTVFNASQIDGVPPLAVRPLNSFEAAEAGERILTNSGAKITHDQADRAYYSRSADDIHLPHRESFKDAAGYYGTALHELAHWTGHPTRLNRATLTDSYRFGDTNYAKEELRAELASVFLAAERGIPHDKDRHAAYVGSWIKALQNDKNEIFKAAHDASAITEYLLALERREEIAPAPAEPTAEEPAPLPEPPEPTGAELARAELYRQARRPTRRRGGSHAARIADEQTLTLDLDFGMGR